MAGNMMASVIHAPKYIWPSFGNKSLSAIVPIDEESCLDSSLIKQIKELVCETGWAVVEGQSNYVGRGAGVDANANRDSTSSFWNWNRDKVRSLSGLRSLNVLSGPGILGSLGRLGSWGSLGLFRWSPSSRLRLWGVLVAQFISFEAR